MSLEGTTASMEARLSALESKLGLVAGRSKPHTEDDLDARLNELKALYEASTESTFRDSCAESDRLLVELGAGTALTHQTSVSSTPLYYRRQEVLSSAGSLKIDMDQLSQLLNLLLVSQPPRDEGQQQPLREEEVTQAPIVNQTPISRDEERRLDVVQADLADLQDKTQMMASRVDSLLQLYYSLMATSSEKLVIADEELSQREQKK